MTILLRGLSSLSPVASRSRGPSRGEPVVQSSSIQLSDRMWSSYAVIYGTQPWVQVAVNKLSRGIGRLPLKPYQRDGDARTRLRVGELATLTRRPMGAGVSPFQWKSAIVGNVALWGNCVAVKVQRSPDAPVDEIWPFSPLGWRVEPNGNYVYRPPSGGDEVTFPAWRIWHSQFWAPTTNGFGQSPLEPLRRTLAIEDAAQRLGVASFANGLRPSGVLTSKQSLKDDVIKRLAASIKRIHGTVDNAFKPLLLEADLGWLPFSFNMDDSAVIEHRQLSREEIAAVFDLPQPTIGILENANFASVDALHIMLYQDSFGPWTVMFEEGFAASVLDGVPEYEEQFVEFDLAEVMRGDYTTRTTGNQKSLAWTTPNEIRQRENLPPSDDPEADRLHIPTGASPDPAVASGAQNVPGQNTSAIVANGVAHV